jgi:hypothetical protein
MYIVPNIDTKQWTNMPELNRFAGLPDGICIYQLSQFWYILNAICILEKFVIFWVNFGIFNVHLVF